MEPIHPLPMCMRGSTACCTRFRPSGSRVPAPRPNAAAAALHAISPHNTIANMVAVRGPAAVMLAVLVLAGWARGQANNSTGLGFDYLVLTR